MTYLELVNRVLVLMREPMATTLVKGDDVVVDIVAQHINDAKRSTEDAHNWNVLRYEWSVAVGNGADRGFLSNSADKSVIIDEVYGPEGQLLKEMPTRKMRQLKAASSATGTAAAYYAVDGTDPVTKNVGLRVYPEPASATTLDVYGFRKQADLSLESDVLLIPSQPVIYKALALASRERGEVGGQTAAEIFAMAAEYLRDAIAQDVALNQYDYDWHIG